MKNMFGASLSQHEPAYSVTRHIVYTEYIFNYTPAVRSNILSKLIFASCVWYSDRAHYGLCVLISLRI